MSESGSLVCVSLGMVLGAHISPISKKHIEQADIVFVAISDGIFEQWVRSMNENTISLQPYYGEGKERVQTYDDMVEGMMVEVRAGRNVCGAFYGHAGVYACVPHNAISKARREGFESYMEPGISAEDCLIADLGIDPGEIGCISYEANQLLFYKKPIDPTSYLFLWQVVLTGDRSTTKFETGPEYRQVLVEKLNEFYSLDHQIIIYEAATLPIHKTRMNKIKLRDFVTAELTMKSTLVIPPSEELQVNPYIMKKLDTLDKMNTAEI
jgi:hypothetical protein